MLRLWIGHWVFSAPKSLFTVFRVPWMNSIHGLLAAAMLSHASDFEARRRRASYENGFLTLLLAIALKSNFEAMEVSVHAVPTLLGFCAPWLGVGTLLSVVGGIGVAIWQGRRAPLPWPELRLTRRDKVVFAALVALYAAVAATSLVVSHRTGSGGKSAA